MTRTAKPRIARKQVDGKYVKYMLYPELGEKARNNGHVVYSLDFDVTPHLLRHTYITNLIHASVDPKTVQYLAGHENSRITMDIYAKVKYNRPDDVVKAMTSAFASSVSASEQAARAIASESSPVCTCCNRCHHASRGNAFSASSNAANPAA